MAGTAERRYPTPCPFRPLLPSGRARAGGEKGTPLYRMR